MKRGTNLRRFLSQQKMYMWMLIFVVGFTAVLFGSEALAPDRKALEGEIEQMELTEMVDRIEQQLEAKLPSNPEELAQTLEEASPLAVFFLSFALLGALSMVVGLILTLVVIGLVVARREILRPIVKHISVKWNIWDICKVVILFSFFGYVVNILEAIFTKVGVFGEVISGNLTMAFNTTFLDLLCIFFIGYFVIIEYKEKWASLGLTLKKYLKSTFLGLIGYITILPTMGLILFLVSMLAERIGYRPSPHPLFSIFLKEENMGLVLYYVFLGAIFGPVVEEIFFRGFAYSAIKKRTGPRWAILISAAIFALVHMNIFSFLPVMFLGITMAYLYEKTGSLIPSITLHIIHNSILISFVFLIRGLIA